MRRLLTDLRTLTSFCPLSSLSTSYSSERRLQPYFETDENVEWWFGQGLFFFLFFLSSLNFFDDLRERHVNCEGGVIFSLTGISELISCLYFAPVATDFPVCFLTKRATGTVRFENFMRWQK